MSMHDIVHINDKWLTQNLKGCEEWGTKSLLNGLFHFTITQDGYLKMNGLTNTTFNQLANNNHTGEIRVKRDSYELLFWCVEGEIKDMVQIT